MSPNLKEGDHVLVIKIVNHAIRPSSVIVFKRRGQSHLEIKRIKRIEKDKIFVIGDNDTHSFDSRHYGPIDRKAIVGIAILRLYPLGHIKGL